ncbi:MAG TPA: class I SAM-dependent methyltransferase [Dehalococcoidia bacterium]|nr:class I SAM-dependent methyltransferase [Dehalococcoidia bacterium]
MNENEMLSPREFYDIMAPYYESFIESTRFSFLSLEAEEKFIVTFIQRPRTVLDVGCGTGRTMKLLYDGKRELFGVDISRKMVELAGNQGLKVIQASAYHLPFPDSCFEAIYSLHGGFGYCQNNLEMEMLLLELSRVLQRGGIMLMDTPHGKVRGEQYITSWSAGDITINMTSYGKTEENIKEALSKTGFGQMRFFGGYDEAVSLQDDSRRIIVVSTKT